MSDGMSIHSIDNMLEAALTGLAKRQEVTGNNIANIDTPGFKASRVSFEDKLKEAVNGQPNRPQVRLVTAHPAHLSSDGTSSTDWAPQVSTVTNTRLKADGNNVDIDLEMIELVETGVRYNALARLVSTRLSLLKNIVSGGR